MALWRAAQIFTWEAAESNETFLMKRKIKSVESRDRGVYSRGKEVAGKIVP